MKILRMIPVLSIIICFTSAAADSVQPLFYIERSLNANVVHYDAQIDDKGALNRNEPVIAYWLMNAEDGRRESLTFIERTTAYGFSAEPDIKTGDYLLAIVSIKERPIRIFMADGKAQAVTTIRGKDAFLERVFIQASGAFSRPHAIEFYGKDTATGEDLSEKVNIE